MSEFIVELGPLVNVLDRLSKIGVVPRAGTVLASTATPVVRELGQSVLSEVPAFSASHNPQILPALQQHSLDHLDEICRLFDGGRPGDFDFVKVHARLRAEQRFPLEATLHAYRCGQKVLSQWLRDAATSLGARSRLRELRVAAVADFAIEYTNAISTIVTSEYVAHTRQIAEAEGDQRTELMTILLSGYDESDGRVARLLRRAGYLEQRQSYCVAVAQSTNPMEMEHPERAQRLMNAIAREVSSTSIRQLSAVRGNLATFVLSDNRRQSGWTASREHLAERVQSVLRMLGPAVLVGISADHPSTSFLPKALHEASTALELADVTHRVVTFAGVPIRALLVHRGADQVRSAPPAWTSSLIDADQRTAGMLAQTLRALAEADLNVQSAARELGKHPNTIYARIERVRTLTGLDARRFTALSELLLALDCLRH